MQRHQGEPIPHHHLQAGTSNSTPARPPLVGRRAEMDRLAAQLSRAARGQGCAIFLVGEAGIGKTRLAHEALVLAREQGFLILEGSAYELEGRLAYAPILAAFGPFLRRLDSAHQARLVSGLPDLGRLFTDLRLPAPLSLGDPALEKTRLFEAVARLLEQLTRETPVLLFLDDLHWADPSRVRHPGGRRYRQRHSTSSGWTAGAGRWQHRVGGGAMMMAFAGSQKRLTTEQYVALQEALAISAVTRQVVATSGDNAQFDYLSGDLFTIDLGRSAYDLAIVGNLCHLFDEAANRHLLGRLFDALRPGGTLAILDALPNERLNGPRSVVLYALGLLLRTSRGQVYPFSTYVGWLREVGYEAVERLDLSPIPPISLITARRPGEDEGRSGTTLFCP